VAVSKNVVIVITNPPFKPLLQFEWRDTIQHVRQWVPGRHLRTYTEAFSEPLDAVQRYVILGVADDEGIEQLRKDLARVKTARDSPVEIKMAVTAYEML